MSAVLRTSDPVWDAERATWQKEPIPVCETCGQEILDDEIYDLGGEICCEDCLRERFHIDYIEYCRRYA